MTATFQTIAEYALGQPVGQCRAVPVNLGPDRPAAFLAAFSADFDVDPYPEMFFFPKDTLKLALCDMHGRELWRRDLGPDVIPGMWFVPILPVDLDGDGIDEIYFVGNRSKGHPLSHGGRVLERLDALTGETTGQWPWPRHLDDANPSYAYRNFLLTGQVRGEPVLVTAQGTYGDMYLQGWNRDLTPRWEISIPADSPGARGSHMTPVVDWDGDGDDEFFWGERLIRFDDGHEMFCADRETYDGHSDIIQPFRVPGEEGWRLFTCRETEHTNHNFPERGRELISPRIAGYGPDGERLWGALETGHIDMGFVAQFGPDEPPLACGIRIGAKTCGADGRFHTEIEEFFFNAATGEPREMPWKAYQVIPVDLDGDGRHEFIRGAASSEGGAMWNAAGESLGKIDGSVALGCKLTEHPGEQVLSYHKEGFLRLWATVDGEETEAASRRQTSRFYQSNRRHMSTGSNLVVLGGA